MASQSQIMYHRPVMGTLTAKHWALIGGMLSCMAISLNGLNSWSEALHPSVLAGFCGQLGVLIGAIFVGAPTSTAAQPPK